MGAPTFSSEPKLMTAEENSDTEKRIDYKKNAKCI